MAKILDEFDREMSPCIVAKAKKALGIYSRSRGNKKSCTPEYWTRTLKAVAEEYGLNTSLNISAAVRDYDKYF